MLVKQLVTLVVVVLLYVESSSVTCGLVSHSFSLAAFSSVRGEYVTGSVSTWISKCLEVSGLCCFLLSLVPVGEEKTSNKMN